MRIAVLGNCQAGVIAPCTEFLSGFPTDHFDYHESVRLWREGEAKLTERLQAYDVVLTQPYGKSGRSEHPGTQDILDRCKRGLVIPNLYFTAFHPDLVYAQGPDGTNIQSPLGDYHSQIALGGYMAGFSADETIALFRREVFEAMGFFLRWPVAQKAFFDQCRDYDFPIAEAFAGWTRRGVFLHTINHPKLYVLEDIARIALKLLGIRTSTASCEDYIHDGMLNVVWPVYPEIARTLSIEGSYIFRRESFPKPPRDRFPPYLELEAFVRGSFELYAALDPDAIVCPAARGLATHAAAGAFFARREPPRVAAG